MNKPCKIEFLDAGEWCQSLNLSANYRNIQVINVSPCSVLVAADKRENENEPWNRVREYIACSTMIIPCEKPEKTYDEPGAEKSIKIMKTKKEKLPINYPEKFNMKELVAANPTYKYPSLYLIVQEEIKSGRIQVTDRTKIPGQKGKPVVTYGLIKNNLE